MCYMYSNSTGFSYYHVGGALYKHRVGPRLLVEGAKPFGRERTGTHVDVDDLTTQATLRTAHRRFINRQTDGQ